MHLSELQHRLMGSIQGDENQSVPVANSPLLSADERAAIYRRMYRLRCEEAVKMDFPRLRIRLGEQLLESMVAGFIKTRPPDSYSLNWATRGFAEFMKERISRADYEIALFEEREAITCLYPHEVLPAENPQYWVLKSSVFCHRFAFDVFDWNPDVESQPRTRDFFAVMFQDPHHLGFQHIEVTDPLHQLMLERMIEDRCSFVSATELLKLDDQAVLTSLREFASLCGRYTLLTRSTCDL